MAKRERPRKELHNNTQQESGQKESQISSASKKSGNTPTNGTKMETPNAGNAMVIQMEEFSALGKDLWDEELHRLGKRNWKTENPTPVKVDKMQKQNNKAKVVTTWQAKPGDVQQGDKTVNQAKEVEKNNIASTSYDANASGRA
ncbi:hypothetical protein K7X08_023788 [Anisodus acutangulus]|uniref:Uncharacterized protein n=1 Tax=Anisodus acutangulus TaxID=402998 RepID=A0A9Q1QZ31_9SOLA|nr:hypothetical protein K7X08_023788 [Anisodus acutangulus]